MLTYLIIIDDWSLVSPPFGRYNVRPQRFGVRFLQLDKFVQKAKRSEVGGVLGNVPS